MNVAIVNDETNTAVDPSLCGVLERVLSNSVYEMKCSWRLPASVVKISVEDGTLKLCDVKVYGRPYIGG